MAEETTEWGSPIAYLVLERGTPVRAAGREQIGTVEHVLFVPEEDVFDGIVVQTAGGLRFVDADAVDRIYERCVLTTLSAEEARSLPAPEDGPAVYDVDPSDGIGPSLHDHYRRLFKKGTWSERSSGEQQKS
jgi:hypothetical protein